MARPRKSSPKRSPRRKSSPKRAGSKKRALSAWQLFVKQHAGSHPAILEAGKKYKLTLGQRMRILSDLYRAHQAKMGIKRKSPKRKSPKRKSPKRKSPKRK